MCHTSNDLQEIASLLADLKKWFGEAKTPLEQRRRAMDRAEAVLKMPEGMTAAPWRQGAVHGQWLSNVAAKDQRVVLFLHGGGFSVGSSKSHRHLAAAVAKSAGADALALDYRLAPEHPFPAALNDAVDAYAAILETAPATRVVIAGDSAGGGLSIAAVLAARAKGLPQPAALVCMCPWLDLSCPPLSPEQRARVDDPMSSLEDARDIAALYLNETPPTDPLASPVFADLSDLPPTLVQVASEELTFRDSLAFVTAARRTHVTLDIEYGLPHVWQWFWPRLRLGRTAIDRIGTFLEATLAPTVS